MSYPEMGRHIRSRRRELKLTQADLAALASVGKRTVEKLEAGEVDPTLSTLQAVGQALGVSLDDLTATISADLSPPLVSP